MSPTLMRPVEAGFWKLHETFDGTYIIDDLFDILEAMDVRAENEARAKRYEEDRRNK